MNGLTPWLIIVFVSAIFIHLILALFLSSEIRNENTSYAKTMVRLYSRGGLKRKLLLISEIIAVASFLLFIFLM